MGDRRCPKSKIENYPNPSEPTRTPKNVFAMKIPGQLGKQTVNFRRSRPRLLERQWKSRFRIGSPRPRSGSRFLPPIAAATPSANRCPPAAAATAETSRKARGSLRKATEGYRSLRKVGPGSHTWTSSSVSSLFAGFQRLSGNNFHSPGLKSKIKNQKSKIP